jgi:O-antigen ligase
VIYFVAPATRLKRTVAMGVALSIPLIAIYAAIGWNQPTGVFAPVRTIRSVMDSDVDTSTLWRDLENYDLYYTLKDNPLLGTGFGHPYVEVVKLPDVSRFYPLYRHAPHNSVLGLLAYAGVIGFAAIWLLVPLGVFFAIRSLDVSSSPRDRAAALTTVGVLVVYILHCYGDMGLGTWTSVFTVGPALALTAKLAVAVGAWPIRPGAGAA